LSTASSVICGLMVVNEDARRIRGGHLRDVLLVDAYDESQIWV
jgi:hypothetical protein